MRIHWIIFILLYLIFFGWYTNLSGPLSQAEIDLVIERMDRTEVKQQFLKKIDQTF